MAIREHPELGAILRCDFSAGFKEPEMVSFRPVVVISPKIQARPQLCTIVALSTTPPLKEMPYHCQINIHPPLPRPFESDGVWVKGDMVYSVGFHRLDLFRMGKDRSGKRIYRYKPLSDDIIKKIQTCVLHGIGLSTLTKHL